MCCKVEMVPLIAQVLSVSPRSACTFWTLFLWFCGCTYVKMQTSPTAVQCKGISLVLYLCSACVLRHLVGTSNHLHMSLCSYRLPCWICNFSKHCSVVCKSMVDVGRSVYTFFCAFPQSAIAKTFHTFLSGKSWVTMKRVIEQLQPFCLFSLLENMWQHQQTLNATCVFVHGYSA